jgi:glycine oxidase ThiO
MRDKTRPDVLIAGGGVMGLSIALHLHRAGCAVTVVDRQQIGRGASWAAAGMLAPWAELLPSGSLQQLCQQSLKIYANWAADLEQQTGLPSGFWPCGILALGSQHWLTAVEHPDADVYPVSDSALQELQSGLSLSKAVWLPQEGQVDPRLLMTALHQAAQQAGIPLLEHTPITWHIAGDQILGLDSPQGRLTAQHYILAMGSWSGLLPQVSVYPRKGQMFALADPARSLHRVLYGDGIYIVPRRDGRIVVGATVEDVGFVEGTAPEQIASLWQAAIDLYPPLASMPVIEQWWGFRPSTPDLSPILGSSPYSNLLIATGHDRNGILLAPITAHLIAKLLLQGQRDPLLESFSWRRFE